MRLAYAIKVTKCHYCGELIPRKAQRLSDTIKTVRGFLRIHFHYPECLIAHADKWFRQNEPEVKMTREGAGRPPLNLNEFQRKLRHKALSRLQYIQKRYGETFAKVNTCIATKNIEKLTDGEMSEYVHAINLRDDAVRILGRNGGLPIKWRPLQGILQQEASPSAVLSPV